ncbi:6-carboxytetrahydropterin synthase [Shewanella surugensis]|uniref:6-carboxy-5,6,7,8-tetrahydropterin synthase n=1 Tax=Shewanella surugensis TaxID=212020 RepID=A0ABT0LKK4_9GAMM|nr:6-carboxytetrahydropterin synthase [Shewanella surugensis]MCL1127842.1 6-carboxytetrahydropterin synthase [Shewanella surugensis]
MHEVIIKRKVWISASHWLHSTFLSDEENTATYGKCNNPNGHGHNYCVTVGLKGPVDEKTGMVLNLTYVAKILDEKIAGNFDHKHLDLDTSYFEERPSTSENIAIVIWQILKRTPLANFLYSIELEETPNNSVLYLGD